MTTHWIFRSLSLSALVVLGAFALAACDESGSNGPATMTYEANLSALNGSGATGTATVTVEGSDFRVSVDAEGTAAERVHAQHIHGTTDGASSSCPDMSADSDGNGRISVSEGAPSYGGILVPLDGSLETAEGLGDLDTFPVAGAQGSYAYDESIATDDLGVNEDRRFADLSLANHAIVLHGAVVDTAYQATLPIACGTLERSN